MVHTSTAVDPRPSTSPSARGERPGDQQQQDRAQTQHAEHQSHQDHQRLQLPDRATLADVVDLVHHAAESRHVARHEPQGPEDAQNQGKIRSWRLDEPFDDGLEDAQRRGRNHLPSQSEDARDRLRALTQHTQQRDNSNQAGQHGEYRVIGQARGEVEAVVAEELVQRAPGQVPPRVGADLSQCRRLQGVVGLGPLASIHPNDSGSSAPRTRPACICVDAA